MKRKETWIVTMILAGSMLITALGGCGHSNNTADEEGNISIITADQNVDMKESSKKENSKVQDSVAMNLKPSSKEESSKAAEKNESSVINDEGNANKEESKAAVNNSKANESQPSKSENSSNTKPSGGNNSSNTTGGNTNTSKPSEPGSNNSKPSSGNSNSKPTTDNSKPTTPSHTHSYSSTVTAATCTSGGYTTYTCSCGSSYTGSQTGALGHSWGNWYTVSEATTSSGGLERRNCSRCGAAEDRATDPLPATEYFLTEADFDEVRSRLIAMGQSYGLTYYPAADNSINNIWGATWDSPNQIWDLTQGREAILDEMVEYCEADFYLIDLNGHTSGFGIGFLGPGETISGAYYEVFIFWV